MTKQYLDGRAILRSRLARWPELDADTELLLGNMCWRYRTAVELTYGQDCTLEFVASYLHVTERTVQRYLRQAHSTAYEWMDHSLS